MEPEKQNPASFSPALRAAAVFLFFANLFNHEFTVAQEPTKSGQKVSEQRVQTEMGPYRCAGLDRPALHNREVLAAMSRVPRHSFVPEDVRPYAYEDMALSIGSGQTISQPFIVGLMTQEAGVSRGSRVLEIGTGSGYQAAVLAELQAEVYTIEIVKELADKARQVLTNLNYKSIQLRQGDGFAGWPEHAPFDAVLVAASSPGYPVALLEQLADNGRLVIPVERRMLGGEILMLVQKRGEEFYTTELGPVRFVPLTGDVRDKDHPVIRTTKGPFKITDIAH